MEPTLGAPGQPSQSPTAGKTHRPQTQPRRVTGGRAGFENEIPCAGPDSLQRKCPRSSLCENCMHSYVHGPGGKGRPPHPGLTALPPSPGCSRGLTGQLPGSEPVPASRRLGAVPPPNAPRSGRQARDGTPALPELRLGRGVNMPAHAGTALCTSQSPPRLDAIGASLLGADLPGICTGSFSTGQIGDEDPDIGGLTGGASAHWCQLYAHYLSEY